MATVNPHAGLLDTRLFPNLNSLTAEEMPLLLPGTSLPPDQEVPSLTPSPPRSFESSESVEDERELTSSDDGVVPSLDDERNRGVEENRSEASPPPLNPLIHFSYNNGLDPLTRA